MPMVGHSFSSRDFKCYAITSNELLHFSSAKFFPDVNAHKIYFNNQFVCSFSICGK